MACDWSVEICSYSRFLSKIIFNWFTVKPFLRAQSTELLILNLLDKLVAGSAIDCQQEMGNQLHWTVRPIQPIIPFSVVILWPNRVQGQYVNESAYRKRRETKHQPSRASCSQQQGCSSISLHFLWGVLFTDPVRVVLSVVGPDSEQWAASRSMRLPAHSMSCAQSHNSNIGGKLRKDGQGGCSFPRPFLSRSLRCAPPFAKMDGMRPCCSARFYYESICIIMFGTLDAVVMAYLYRSTMRWGNCLAIFWYA